MANNIEEHELRQLHEETFRWSLFCAGYDQELAKEILQQTYLKVLSGAVQFRRKSKLKTWLFGIVRLTALELKREERSASYRDLPFDEAEPPTAPLDNLDTAESARQIEGALRELTLMQREIVYLAFYKELTLIEISEALDVSVGTVKKQYQRAKDKLELHLTDRRKEWQTT